MSSGFYQSVGLGFIGRLRVFGRAKIVLPLPALRTRGHQGVDAALARGLDFLATGKAVIGPHRAGAAHLLRNGLHRRHQFIAAAGALSDPGGYWPPSSALRYPERWHAQCGGWKKPRWHSSKSATPASSGGGIAHPRSRGHSPASASSPPARPSPAQKAPNLGRTCHRQNRLVHGRAFRCPLRSCRQTLWGQIEAAQF